jgi:hypothetical protein
MAPPARPLRFVPSGSDAGVDDLQQRCLVVAGRSSFARRSGSGASAEVVPGSVEL